MKRCLVSIYLLSLAFPSCGNIREPVPVEQIAASENTLEQVPEIPKLERPGITVIDKPVGAGTTMPETGGVQMVFRSSKKYILENETKDFSMYDTHPLEIYLGKWDSIDATGNLYPWYRSIEITYDGSQYIYSRPGISEGRLLYVQPGYTILYPDNAGDYIENISLSEPRRKENGSLVFYADGETPIGEFMLDEGEDKFLEAWQVERIGGIWISEFRFRPNSYNWGGPRYNSWDISGINIRIDLESGTLQMPDERLLLIEDAYKEGIDICLTLKTDDDDEAFGMRITPLDYAKAYIVHDRHAEWGDSRFSPEECHVWYLLPQHMIDAINGKDAIIDEGISAESNADEIIDEGLAESEDET